MASLDFLLYLLARPGDMRHGNHGEFFKVLDTSASTRDTPIRSLTTPRRRTDDLDANKIRRQDFTTYVPPALEASGAGKSGVASTSHIPRKRPKNFPWPFRDWLFFTFFPANSRVRVGYFLRTLPQSVAIAELWFRSFASLGWRMAFFKGRNHWSGPL